jgi:hypothetical protein
LGCDPPAPARLSNAERKAASACPHVWCALQGHHVCHLPGPSVVPYALAVLVGCCCCVRVQREHRLHPHHTSGTVRPTTGKAQLQHSGSAQAVHCELRARLNGPSRSKNRPGVVDNAQGSQRTQISAAGQQGTMPQAQACRNMPGHAGMWMPCRTGKRPSHCGTGIQA